MFSHKQIYDRLRKGFEDSPARVMSETLIELAEQQDDKFTRSIDKISEDFEKRLDQIISRMASKEDLSWMASKEDLTRMASKEDLHRELHAQTWRIITAMIACWGLVTGTVYFFAQYLK